MFMQLALATAKEKNRTGDLDKIHTVKFDDVIYRRQCEVKESKIAAWAIMPWRVGWHCVLAQRQNINLLRLR